MTIAEIEKVMLSEAFQAACQRYAHGNGSSEAIAAAAVSVLSESAPSKAEYDEAIIKRDALHLVVSALAGKLELPNETLIGILQKAEEELRAKRWLS